MQHDEKTEKNKKTPLFSRLAEKTGLPVDILRGCPYIQLYGGRCLIVEGKNRIDRYDGQSISVRCGGNLLRIDGENLRVSLLDRDALCVNGYITAIYFDR